MSDTTFAERVMALAPKCPYWPKETISAWNEAIRYTADTAQVVMERERVPSADGLRALVKASPIHATLLDLQGELASDGATWGGTDDKSLAVMAYAEITGVWVEVYAVPSMDAMGGYEGEERQWPLEEWRKYASASQAVERRYRWRPDTEGGGKDGETPDTNS